MSGELISMSEAKRRKADYSHEKGSYMFDVQHDGSWFWYIHVRVDLLCVLIVVVLMERKILDGMED